MPAINSFADYLADWDRLIKSILKNQDNLPDFSGLVGPQDLNVAKAAARSELRQATKRTTLLIPEGRASASRLRAALKAHFGGHNETLVQYGVAPLRKRRSPLPADPPPPSPVIETPTPE
jgi:hypothetical protein